MATQDTTSIDRIAPTRRPGGWPAMFMRWSHLLFLHWEVPAETLRALVPGRLTIDTFEGRAFVGLVPFLMSGVRPAWGPPIPGQSRFPEVNVRTYVHHEGRNPGVWFFSLDAANSLAVRVARWLWHLPYFRANMPVGVRGDGRSPVVDYRSDRLWPAPTPAGCAMRYEPAGEPAAARPGTLDHFLVERYILYARREADLYLGRVHHRPYPLQSAAVQGLDESLVAAAGIERPNTSPLCHYASVVDVHAYWPEHVGPAS